MSGREDTDLQAEVGGARPYGRSCVLRSGEGGRQQKRSNGEKFIDHGPSIRPNLDQLNRLSQSLGYGPAALALFHTPKEDTSEPAQNSQQSQQASKQIRKQPHDNSQAPISRASSTGRCNT